ncbi:MAG: IS21 family transposase, partial [Myxococcaceae bacterium]|nr:IS21 family transposase [Myxococcaceae bacterium]
MDQWAEIRRRVLVEGVSQRQIQRETGLHHATLKKILANPEPPGYRRTKGRRKPVVGPFLERIHEILRADQQVHRKQRHTAMRIWERLRKEHGYTGQYNGVKLAVRAWRMGSQEAFVPLRHDPAHGQVDFGKVLVRLAGVEVPATMFVATLPFSDALFVQVYPRECQEAFHAGHVAWFEWLGGVPIRISYDNLKLAVRTIVGGRGKDESHEFTRLRSYHCFAAHFCRVRRPNEKGHVETLVKFARQNFLVPIPEVADFATLNTWLREQCTADLQRQLRGQAKPKGELVADERPHFLPLPTQRFEARRVETTRASSLALVRFDRNDYSVPTRWAHHPVTVIGGIDAVRIVAQDQVVATHPRCWARAQVCFEPVHYLALLERKPGAFDFARPLAGWQLPESVQVLRRRLERDLGHRGTREFIRVLRLLEHCGMADL